MLPLPEGKGLRLSEKGVSQATGGGEISKRCLPCSLALGPDDTKIPSPLAGPTSYLSREEQHPPPTHDGPW